MTYEEKIDLLKKIDIGVRKGAARAKAKHKKDGRPMYIWENGRVVEIPPEKIEVPEENTETVEKTDKK